jgi:hypothetical protein
MSPRRRGVLRGPHRLFNMLDDLATLRDVARMPPAPRPVEAVAKSDAFSKDRPTRQTTRERFNPRMNRDLLAALRDTPLKYISGSSAVQRFGFAPEVRMAIVVFKGGPTRYGYPHLDDDEVRGLLEVLEHDESLGHYIATVIKPNHDHERVQL